MNIWRLNSSKLIISLVRCPSIFNYISFWIRFNGVGKALLLNIILWKSWTTFSNPIFVLIMNSLSNCLVFNIFIWSSVLNHKGSIWRILRNIIISTNIGKISIETVNFRRIYCSKLLCWGPSVRNNITSYWIGNSSMGKGCYLDSRGR